MAPVYYQILHIVGIVFLFIGIGGLLANGDSRGAMKFHGIGLVLLLVAGFGMIAKLGYSYSAPWVIGKMIVWLLLGFLPVLARKRVVKPSVVVWLSILLGAVAACLVYVKPGAVAAGS